MSSFDSVLVECPKCGHTNKVQSKAGGCSMLDYSSKYVPIEIAVDLDGEVITCTCGKKLKLIGNHEPLVKMFIWEV